MDKCCKSKGQAERRALQEVDGLLGTSSHAVCGGGVRRQERVSTCCTRRALASVAISGSQMTPPVQVGSHLQPLHASSR